MEAFFPELFHNVLSTAFWAKMKEKALQQADAILTGKNIEEELNAADRYFASLINLKKFSGKDNDELKYDKFFEKNCILLTNMTNQPVKDLSTKEYFSLIQYHNENNGGRTYQERGYN